MSAFYTTHHWRRYPAQPRPEVGWVEGWRRHVLWICAGMIAQREQQRLFENAVGAAGFAQRRHPWPQSPIGLRRPRNKRRRKRGKR